MKARPILFSAPMIRALIAGQKKATRRIVQPARHPYGERMAADEVAAEFLGGTCAVRSPYGAPGDLLWVRETWAASHAYDHLPPRLILNDARIHFAATAERGGLLWRPSIHMPRWASRITLRITDARVQRLQEISEEDAIAEGVEGAFVEDGRYWRNYGLSDEDAACSPMLVSPIHSFKSLWESIYGPESWHDDPFVWALTFEVIKANVDAVIAETAP